MKRASLLLLTMLFVGTASGTAVAAGSLPVIEKVWAWNISPTAATLSMRYLDQNQNARLWFEYSKDANLSAARKAGERVAMRTGRVAQTPAELGGLQADTVYYFRAFVRNDGGESHSPIASFRTTTTFEPPAIRIQSGEFTGGNLLITQLCDGKGSPGVCTMTWSTSPAMNYAKRIAMKQIAATPGGIALQVHLPVTVVPDNMRVYIQGVMTTARGTATSDVREFTMRHK